MRQKARKPLLENPQKRCESPLVPPDLWTRCPVLRPDSLLGLCSLSMSSYVLTASWIHVLTASWILQTEVTWPREPLFLPSSCHSPSSYSGREPRVLILQPRSRRGSDLAWQLVLAPSSSDTSSQPFGLEQGSLARGGARPDATSCRQGVQVEWLVWLTR